MDATWTITIFHPGSKKVFAIYQGATELSGVQNIFFKTDTGMIVHTTLPYFAIGEKS